MSSWTRTRVALVVACVLLAAAVGLAAPAAADAAPSDEDPIESVTQSVPDTADPGDTVTVELTIAIDGDIERLDVVTTFEPAVADVTVIDDDGATVSEVTDANDELVASYGDVDEVTLEYEVAIAEDAAEDDTVELVADVEADEAFEREATDTITVVDETIENVTRDVPAGATAGDTVEVTTTAELDEPTTNVSITDQFETPVADLTIVDDDNATVSEATDANDELAASWGDVRNVTLVYELTLPEDDVEAGDSYAITTTVAADAETTTESHEIVISDVPGAVEYADPDTGEVDANGMLDAASDFRERDDVDANTLLDAAAGFRSDDPVF
ncbi:hypothetical protein J2751_002698 [Halorubrum alkaliphilum]|uniref:Uncharacterized protein n=1 Tax=Halorubrum alkaliphilum TaxID=261290 RepID=A0A8T4GHN3_9EURY|nr:hypothetical protein [Halorubrum alkaliphilum]MBP1923653.1 hypothetical protein [Halorubrum alkaliphilum]